jgi:predicted nucleic-acid-binding Zn-ribbon protein
MNEHKCLACGGTKFSTRSLLMSTAGATLIGLDWLNPTVTAYTCEQCGYVMLYAQVAAHKQEEEQHKDPSVLEKERRLAMESFVKRSKIT